ncbi:hypothetical protein FNF28_04804 [Cafeteria roenbergensis]|uniref:Uncharacterized protein n=1 Tax=Cafeteria roenbergensis TaxID=33653 RepID=A0A5A8DBB4_CAFRO|nr:hypothetical protein FNF28_04804 [Cafeteria roenbergensis]
MAAAAAMSAADMGKELWEAAGAGNTGEVARLLEAGAPVNWAGGYGQTPLMRAAERGHIESMRVMLDRGADLEAKDIEGCTALIVAVCSGKVEAMVLLLDRGADLEAKNNVCACRALQSGHTAVLTAAFYGRVEAMALLLDRGADLEAKDNAGATALMGLLRGATRTSFACCWTVAPTRRSETRLASLSSASACMSLVCERFVPLSASSDGIAAICL